MEPVVITVVLDQYSKDIPLINDIKEVLFGNTRIPVQAVEIAFSAATIPVLILTIPMTHVNITIQEHPDEE